MTKIRIRAEILSILFFKAGRPPFTLINNTIFYFDIGELNVNSEKITQYINIILHFRRLYNEKMNIEKKFQ